MRLLIASILASVAASSSCSGPCTLIGCANGVTLRVKGADGASVSAFEGTVTIAGRTIAIDCGGTPSQSADFTCRDEGVFVAVREDRIPASIDVSLQSQDGTKSFDATVSPGDRVVTYPNGEECDPGCESASADVVLQ